jgi:hypothetical protein
VQADINGPQRKVLRSSVRPERTALGTEGIPVRDGKTLPFVVARGWNAPAGYYPEAFYIVAPGTGEVYYASPTGRPLIWGLPSVTDVETTVGDPIELPPGSYEIVFSLGGLKGGTLVVDAFDVGERAA